VLVASLESPSERVFVELAHDWRVFLFVALIGTATCIIVGLVPAIRATATDPGAAMKAGSRGSTDTRERFGMRRLLVVVQVALSLVLVVGALLFARSFRNLETVDAGFAKDHLVIAIMDFSRAGVPDDRIRTVPEQLLDDIRRLPGVQGAARVRNVPIGGSFSNRSIVVDGVVRTESVNYNAVSDRYFQTMGSALLAGRDFDAGDNATAPRVAIVTESFVRVFFGGRNPIGRTFQIDEPPGKPRPPYEIVGVTRDAKYTDLRDPFEPLFYAPSAQDNVGAAAYPRYVMRSALPASSIAPSVTALARGVAPSAIVKFRTMESQVEDSLVRERLMASLSGFFGGLAALIATIGLYGVMSYSVARRRNEIGIRMALGANRRDVVRMVMREAATLLAAGLIVGTLAALAAARSARTLLFGLQPHDPASIVMAAVSLAIVAALASYLPALRASHLEPTEALREE
jgi:putative ABC transport system permease protein